MDDSQFDAWTRRRFGRAMSGGLASLVGLGSLGTASTRAKITAQADRCRNVKEQCNPDKKKQKCCRHLRCETNEDTGNARCCKPLRTSCHQAEMAAITAALAVVNSASAIRTAAAAPAVTTSRGSVCSGLSAIGYRLSALESEVVSRKS